MDGVRSHMHLWPEAGVAIVFVQNGEGAYYGAVHELVAALQKAGALPVS